MAPNKVL
jgi:hypothetical protein